jgi:hypothetical protein
MVKKKKKGKASPSRLRIVKEKPKQNLQSHEWYKAEFTEASTGDSKFGGEYLRLQFKILDGYMEDDETPAEGTMTSALMDADIEQGKKSYELIAGILGADPDLTDDLDITPYYGDVYEVNILTEQKKNQDRAHSNVVAIRKPRKKKKKSKDSDSEKKKSKKVSSKKSSKKKKSKKSKK